MPFYICPHCKERTVDTDGHPIGGQTVIFRLGEKGRPNCQITLQDD